MMPSSGNPLISSSTPKLFSVRALDRFTMAICLDDIEIRLFVATGGFAHDGLLDVAVILSYESGALFSMV
ncbi:unnamed protein product [Protopolystoma xenopodis]|uniref:Uncharacterized protein n=1 Tax=Protopolystoma xenopodis TaxID=117903 RepID=A0A448XH68_9PLAT|nr:unnamed protein product [Protopolystoma xenopodis]